MLQEAAASQGVPGARSKLPWHVVGAGSHLPGGPETPKLVAIQRLSRDVAHSIVIVPRCAAFLVAFASVSHSRTKTP